MKETWDGEADKPLSTVSRKTENAYTEERKTEAIINKCCNRDKIMECGYTCLKANDKNMLPKKIVTTIR